MPESVQIQTVKTEGFEMDYFTFGAGERAFVILPGASVTSVMLSADAVAAAYDCFTDDYTVYVFDVEKNIPKGFGIKDMAKDTAEAMRYLGIENADVFGCSLGGMLAQVIAAHEPELVRRVILSSTQSRPNDVSTENCGRWAELADSGDARTLNRSIFGSIYSPAFYEQYRDILTSMEDTGTEEDLRRFSVVIRACRDFDFYDELEKIICPVLVMGSRDDMTLSSEGLVDIAQKLRCPLYMYSGYGHAVYDEAPDFRDRILDFLNN